MDFGPRATTPSLFHGSRLLLGSALLALTATSACDRVTVAIDESSAPVSETAPPTVDDAREFIERVEREFEAISEEAARVYWVQANFITYDTNYLAAKMSARTTELGVGFANEAKRFDALELPPDVARSMMKIKLGLTLPAPETPGVAAELAEISTEIQAAYSSGTITRGSAPLPEATDVGEILRTPSEENAAIWRKWAEGEVVSQNEAELLMQEVRDPATLTAIWTKWREVSPPMRENYARLVEIANEGAQELGFADTGAMWRGGYDMLADEFAAVADGLWSQVKPLYNELHCHVRAKLNEVHGDDIVPLDQPIRADLFGNMWGQSWGNIYEYVAPENADPGYDLTERLVALNYTPVKMAEAGESFFSSLGFDPLPDTFWERSLFSEPRDRKVTCHASAWDLDAKDDIRIKMCTKVNADDFQTIHHELGHNYYQRAYKHQRYLHRDGAHDGFHEAIGDMIALSITPDYLNQTGIISEVPDASKDIGLLMQQALNKVAFLPFGLLVDKWRWQVFSGEVGPGAYNDAWWALRLEYQGLTPPVDRGPDAFDPGAKYHIPASVPYMRYFLAHILQFQFHETACQLAGWEGPLHRCSIYGSRLAGQRFNAMLEAGASQPWPDTLEAYAGTREMDGTAVVEYFSPLMEWLREQNADRSCGWGEPETD